MGGFSPSKVELLIKESNPSTRRGTCSSAGLSCTGCCEPGPSRVSIVGELGDDGTMRESREKFRVIASTDVRLSSRRHVERIPDT
jgi:hypothetical protein